MKAQDQVNDLIENEGIEDLLQMIINKFENGSQDFFNSKQLKNHFKVIVTILERTQKIVTTLCDDFDSA